MAIEWGNKAPTRNAKSVMWVDAMPRNMREHPSPNLHLYMKRIIQSELVQYKGNPSSWNGNGLPDGMYALMGTDGSNAVYYNHGLHAGVLIPIDKIEQKLGGSYYSSIIGIPKFFVKSPEAAKKRFGRT